MRLLMASPPDPEFWNGQRSALFVLALLVLLWAGSALIRGIRRWKRSGDSQYLRRGIGAVILAAALLCLFAKAFVAADWDSGLNAAGVILMIISCCVACVTIGPPAGLSTGVAPTDLIRMLAWSHPAEATALGKAALRSAPDDARVRHCLLRMSWNAGDLPEARAQAAQIDPEALPPAEREDFVEVRDWLKKAGSGDQARRSPRLVVLLLVLFGFLFLCSLIEVGPHPGGMNAGSWFLLGIIVLLLVPLAWPVFKRARHAWFPEKPYAPVIGGVLLILRSLRKRDLAIAICECRLKARADDEDTRVFLAHALLDAGDRAGSQATLAQVRESGLSEMGREALSLLRAAPELPPSPSGGSAHPNPTGDPNPGGFPGTGTP